MSGALKTKSRHTLEVAISFVPWLMSAYMLYWLQYSEIWTTETPHRGKMSVAILALGMGLSFLVRTFFAKREQRVNQAG